VISLAGDGGFAMLLGELLTTVQEDLPIKIVVYDNGKLGFVDIEQKAAGLVPVYTDLRNPDFGEVAKAIGLWGHSISKAGELEESVQTWLAQPGPAVLHVKVKPMQLVMPPSPRGLGRKLVRLEVFHQVARRRGVVITSEPLLEPAEPSPIALRGDQRPQQRQEEIGCIAQLLHRQPELMPGLHRQLFETPAALEHLGKLARQQASRKRHCRRREHRKRVLRQVGTPASLLDPGCERKLKTPATAVCPMA
jgi:hypothetical protein